MATYEDDADAAARYLAARGWRKDGKMWWHPTNGLGVLRLWDAYKAQAIEDVQEIAAAIGG